MWSKNQWYQRTEGVSLRDQDCLENGIFETQIAEGCGTGNDKE